MQPDRVQALLHRLATSPLREVAPAIWYEAFAPNTPDLLVMRLPEELYAHRSGPPSLRRTLKVVFAETPRDRAYLEACLDKPLPFVNGAVSFRTSVDATNVRPSTFPTSRDLGVLHYAPPASVAEWPHITVTISDMNIADLQLMRGRYYWLAASDEAGAVAQLSQIALQAGLAGMPLLRVLSPRDTANA